MKVSYRWLCELVPVDDISPEDLAPRLTMVGLEVDDIHRPGEALAGMRAVLVTALEPHPEASTLSICTVTDGDGQYRVVCGAPNVRVGMVVPWARPGIDLPGGRVEQKTIRGQKSAGMLCSAPEMGYDVIGFPDGLWELDPGTPAGTSVDQALGLDDAVITLDLTPNYAAHCQGILGVAREVSAVLGRPLVPQQAPHIPERGESACELATVTIEDPDLCPRYTARIVRGLSVGPSPWWIQKRLLLSGIRPHSNVVDITNYVMLETGQPLHAFDLSTLAGRAIIVRRARDGESITTLDGHQRPLSGDDLVIADSSRAVAVAGVMGGIDTEVTETTRDILLESANFDPVSVRKTASRMGIRTDASGRFEKGLDIMGSDPAAARATGLLCQQAGGEAAPGVIDQFPNPSPLRRATLRPDRVNGLLGLDLDPREMSRILTALGCHVDNGPRAMTVAIPSWRVDLLNEIDLVEEVARHHGYDRIPATVPGGAVPPPVVSQDRKMWRLFRNALLGAGFDEAVTYAFTAHQVLDRLRIPTDHPWRQLLPVKNPLGRWQEGMRPALFPGLLLCAGENHRQRQEDLWFFEMDRAYLAHRLPPQELPAEPWRLSVVGTGKYLPDHWTGEGRDLDFFDVKGVMEMLLARFGPVPFRWERASYPWLHPGRAAGLWSEDDLLGWVGELHPEVAGAFSLNGRVICAEMDLDIWWKQTRDVPRFQDWGRYPASGRDLALVVSEEVEAARVEKVICETGSPLLGDVRLFDVYRGEQVGDGQKSLAYSLSYRAADRTLTDAEVDAVHQAIRERLAREVGAQLRS